MLRWWTTVYSTGMDVKIVKDGILYHLDLKQKHRQRAVVPNHLHKRYQSTIHSLAMGGHFAGKKMYIWCSCVTLVVGWDV